LHGAARRAGCRNRREENHRSGAVIFEESFEHPGAHRVPDHDCRAANFGQRQFDIVNVVANTEIINPLATFTVAMPGEINGKTVVTLRLKEGDEIEGPAA
jgi:hypothetical protein